MLAGKSFVRYYYITMKTILAISALILSLSVGYYLVIVLPEKEKMKITVAIGEQRRKEGLLAECMGFVEKSYQNRIANTCIDKTGNSNCSLPLATIDGLRKLQETESENCKTVYGK